MKAHYVRGTVAFLCLLGVACGGGTTEPAETEAPPKVQPSPAEADKAVALLRDAMVWLKKDPKRFPAGVDVVVTNVYEYTDTSGDLTSCPTARLAGMSGNWIAGAPAVVHFQEQIMKVAVDVGIDMVFLAEDFCGHGYRSDDASLQCYRGPSTPRWFDLTCIHPNPAGHAEIARLFRAVVDG